MSVIALPESLAHLFVKFPSGALSVFTIIEGVCFRINEGVAGDLGWSGRVVTAERL
jgi:hypothetical protein